jgi:hypothetical protein
VPMSTSSRPAAMETDALPDGVASGRDRSGRDG